MEDNFVFLLALDLYLQDAFSHDMDETKVLTVDPGFHTLLAIPEKLMIGYHILLT
jgi:hypothetical protein